MIQFTKPVPTFIWIFQNSDVFYKFLLYLVVYTYVIHRYKFVVLVATQKQKHLFSPIPKLPDACLSNVIIFGKQYTIINNHYYAKHLKRLGTYK